MKEEALGGDVTGEGRHVAVHGELDLATSSAFAAAIDTLVLSGGSDIAVDMAHVSFVDSTALNVLVNASQALAATGGRVIVLRPSPVVSRVLQVSGLATMFAV